MTGIQLLARLKANVPSVDDRVTSGKAQQGTPTPYLVVRKITKVSDYTHSGNSGLKVDRYQMHMYSAIGLEECHTVGGEIQSTLESWKSDGVSSAYQANETEGYESDTKLFFVRQDYIIRHK